MDEDTAEEEALLFLLLRRRRKRQKLKKKRKKLRFCVRDIIRQRKQYGEYGRLVQELKTGDRKFILITLYVHYSFLYYEDLQSRNSLTVSGENIVLIGNS